MSDQASLGAYVKASPESTPSTRTSSNDSEASFFGDEAQDRLENTERPEEPMTDVVAANGPAPWPHGMSDSESGWEVVMEGVSRQPRCQCKPGSGYMCFAKRLSCLLGYSSFGDASNNSCRSADYQKATGKEEVAETLSVTKHEESMRSHLAVLGVPVPQTLVLAALVPQGDAVVEELVAEPNESVPELSDEAGNDATLSMPSELKMTPKITHRESLPQRLPMRLEISADGAFAEDSQTMQLRRSVPLTKLDANKLLQTQPKSTLFMRRTRA